MEKGVDRTIHASISRLLKPLVRVLLRFGVPFGVLSDIAKQIYVETAMQEFAIPGRKMTISRASVITGLSRKEVLRVQRLATTSDQPFQDRYNRAVRVVSGWVRDAAFTGRDGAPKPLPMEGGPDSFAALVGKYSGDVPPRAILDELERVSMVERMESGEVRLLSPAFVPAGDEQDKLGILGSDVADLIATIDHNLQHSGADSRFQLKAAYDNLPLESLESFRRLSSGEAMNLLRRFDQELSRMDRDTNPESRGIGRYRAGVSIYYFEENLPEGGGEEE